MNHKDAEVQDAMVKLMDALCSWERATGRTNLLLIIEPESDFLCLALDGKPERTRDVLMVLSTVRSELDRLDMRRNTVKVSEGCFAIPEPGPGKVCPSCGARHGPEGCER